MRVEVWCLKCKGQGHDKDHCPIYQNYLIGGGLVPLKPENIVGPRVGVPLWCTIFQIAGKHATDNCHILQKFVHTPQLLFFTFSKLGGHDECNFRSYELMTEWTPTYRMLTENRR